MKNKILFALLAFIGFVFVACEKDDICSATTPTTPRLIIEFYNQASPEEIKNVSSLALVSTEIDVDTLKFANVTRIEVPLMTTQDQTQYHFVLNYQNPNPALVFDDLLEFNYSRENLFVSRACGYKTLFNLNSETDPDVLNPIILNGIPNDESGEWIKNIVIENANLENETDVHVKIYF